uniref:Uncharacterized protein n=1 Tax=Lepeophtheirus salmonis TaxID=72036 RepID=A0A0K2T564_LEPSM
MITQTTFKSQPASKYDRKYVSIQNVS